MIKLLVGILTDEGGIVKHSTPSLTSKEANQLLDNVLFSANIYGQSSSSRKDISFTIPIMYLPGFSHGRIYFKYSSKSQLQQPNPLILDVLGQDTKKFPISLFCSFEQLNEDLDSEIVSELDNFVWNFLKSDIDDIAFENLVKGIQFCVDKID